MEHNLIDSKCTRMFSNTFSDSYGGWFNGGWRVIEHDAVRRSNGVQLVILFHSDYSCLHVRNWLHHCRCFPYYRNRAMAIL